MSVSCVIPTRDRCEMVIQAIDSVLTQSRPVDEIIVVDDGSVDNTGVRLAEAFPKVTLLRLDGLGPGPARNAGVQHSFGEIVMFLDSDDIWRPDHVESLLGKIEAGFEVAYGVCRTVDEINSGEFTVPGPGQGRQGGCLEALSRWCFLLPSAVAVTRKAFDRVGGFTGGNIHEIGEDWLFFLKLAQHFEFGFVDRQITLRRLHAGSLCSLAGGGKILAGLRMIRQHLATEKNICPPVLERLAAHEKWVAENGAAWNSVQQWYESIESVDS